jgi:hypothetical protein
MGYLLETCIPRSRRKDRRKICRLYLSNAFDRGLWLEAASQLLEKGGKCWECLRSCVSSRLFGTPWLLPFQSLCKGIFDWLRYFNLPPRAWNWQMSTGLCDSRQVQSGASDHAVGCYVHWNGLSALHASLVARHDSFGSK